MATIFKKKFIRVPNLHLGGAVKEIGRNAFVDWILVLVVSFIVALLLALGGVYLYWQISSGNFKGTDKAVTNSKKVFDEKELVNMIALFAAKEDATAQIKKGYSGPPDPSK